MIHVGLPRGQAGWLVYDPRSRAIRVCADVTFDKTFQTVAPATHTAFSDAVPVHTPLSWHLTSTDLQSSVPADDHYGTPQLGYAEDDPTDGFLLSSQNGTTLEIFEDLKESSETSSEEEDESDSAEFTTPLLIPTPSDDSPITDRPVNPGEESLYRDPIVASSPRRSSRSSKPRDFWNPAVNTDFTSGRDMDFTSFVDTILDRSNYEQVKVRMFDPTTSFAYAAS